MLYRILTSAAVSGLLLSVPQLANSDGFKNYSLVIDGKTHDIDIGIPITVTRPDGSRSTIVLRKKPYVQVKLSNTTFQIRSELEPAVQKPEEGITDCSFVTPHAVLVVVQDYDYTVGTSADWVSTGMKLMTDDLVALGYKMDKSEDVIKKLSDGAEMKGNKVSHVLGNEVSHTIVVAHAFKKGGTVIMMQYAPEDAKADKALLDHFWHTLRIRKQPK